MISTKQKPPSHRARLVLPFISCMVLMYFGYHIYNGVYGLKAQAKTECYIHTLESTLKGLEEKRRILQNNINRLKDGNIEKDTLDEYARAALNLCQKDEWIVLLTQGDLQP